MASGRMGERASGRSGDGETERQRDWVIFVFCVPCFEAGGLDCQIYLTEDNVLLLHACLQTL